MKSINIKQLKKEVKNEKKKETKKETNMKKVVTLTVLTTLTLLALIVTIFYYGMQYGIGYEKSVNDRIVSEAKVLSASIKEAPLK